MSACSASSSASRVGSLWMRRRASESGTLCSRKMPKMAFAFKRGPERCGSLPTCLAERFFGDVLFEVVCCTTIVSVPPYGKRTSRPMPNWCQIDASLWPHWPLGAPGAPEDQCSTAVSRTESWQSQSSARESSSEPKTRTRCENHGTVASTMTRWAMLPHTIAILPPSRVAGL